MSDSRPNVKSVMARLKGFQRDTVEYAFERLYVDKKSTHRFLVADEVGLGKTLVARGVVAKAIDKLWNKVDRIDVVYICSNAQIARQNIRRLAPTPEQEVMHVDRLTLLPKAIGDLDSNRVNFIAFTPGTSFDLKSSMGRWEERVLLYHMMQSVWPRRGLSPINLFQGYVGDADWFREKVRRFLETNTIDSSIKRAFAKRVRQQVRDDRGAGGPHLRKRYYDLCRRFHRQRKHVPRRDKDDRAALIGELRGLLAATCVDALEPDLVILDEFQRFKTLLEAQDEAGLLAKGLFEYSDDSTDVRILMLSATPYKMYTLHHESQEDDHYEDFLRTVAFIARSEGQTESFEQLLGEYRRELYRLADGGDAERLTELKAEVEQRLRRFMCRTERLRTTEQHDGMLVERTGAAAQLYPADVRAFRDLQDIAARVDQPGVIEFWKSAPYLLSFMDDYMLKKRFQVAVEKNTDVTDCFRRSPHLQLPWQEFDNYEPIDPQNARLRTFLEWIEETNLWRLLWVPPTLPYTQLQEPFATAYDAGFTKRLMFSTWAVVPKTVASLLSYEAERRAFREFQPDAVNTAEERRRRRPLLRFAFSRGRLTGMANFGILYPSASLAEKVDPLKIAKESGGAPTVEEALLYAQDILRPRIDGLIAQHAVIEDEREDEAWYWATPILLDLDLHHDATVEWFAARDLASAWEGFEADDDDESRWGDHVERAAELVRNELVLGKPPADLLEVISLMALAAPGTVAMRALTRRGLGGASASEPWLRAAAAQIAWGFRSLFNLLEAMAVVRRGAEETPYWRRVLEYGAAGCLQAVVDEHAHLLRDLEGLTDREPEVKAREIAIAMQDALSLRASTSQADEIDPDAHQPFAPRRLRNNFALRFGNQKSEDGSDGVRIDRVRGAFNSPYRPFVLATTSFGQEGLDFHAYSHAVVHWNLPSNPVDLEQREGRVHRYKGHAVRKNVAAEHGAAALATARGDAWERLFEIAAENTDGDGGGLKPYWVFPGEFAIERHVPRLPLSRDDYQLAVLKRSLAVYRMVFGQPRQDDLMAFLLEQLGEERLRGLVGLLQVDLSPSS